MRARVCNTPITAFESEGLCTGGADLRIYRKRLIRLPVFQPFMHEESWCLESFADYLIDHEEVRAAAAAT